MKKNRILFYLTTPYLLYSCAYVQGVSKHDVLVQNQKINPGLHNLKHMIDRDTFFIYGLILDKSGTQTDQPLSVAAYSDRFKPHELALILFYRKISSL